MSSPAEPVERAGRAEPTAALAVDRVRCTGHGVCARLLPEAVTLDEWGYPIVERAVVPGSREVATAIRLCPSAALYSRDARDSRAPGPAGPR